MIAYKRFVACGDCAKRTAIDTPSYVEDLTCGWCGYTSEECDFPDYRYQGIKGDFTVKIIENKYVKEPTT